MPKEDAYTKATLARQIEMWQGGCKPIQKPLAR